MGVGANYIERERDYEKTLSPSGPTGGRLARRWVYFYENIDNDSTVTIFEDVARRAAAKLYNGIILGGGSTAFRVSTGENARDNIVEIYRIARAHGLDLIPSAFQLGSAYDIAYYSSDLIHYVEGALVRGTTFRVTETSDGGLVAVHVPEIDYLYKFDQTYMYGDTELFSTEGYDAITSVSGTKMGTMSFPDHSVGRTDSSSLRIENLHLNNPAALHVYLKTTPRRSYKFSVWVKTEGLNSSDLRMYVEEGSGPYMWRTFVHNDVSIPKTGDWQKVEFGFNSMDMDRVIIVVGIYGATTGKIWFDDMEIEEVGLLNVLRRPGTPVTVRDKDDATLYVEGTDYGYISDPYITMSSYRYLYNHDEPTIEILDGGRIAQKFEQTGDVELSVDFYHGLKADSYYPCLSEPRVYAAYAEQYEILCAALPHDKLLIGIDEIRVAANCMWLVRIGACRRRRLWATVPISWLRWFARLTRMSK